MLPLLKAFKKITNKVFGIKEVEAVNFNFYGEAPATVLKTRSQLIAEGRGASIARRRIRSIDD